MSEKGLASLVFWLIETNQTNQINQNNGHFTLAGFFSILLVANMPSSPQGSGPKSLRFRPIIVALP